MKIVYFVWLLSFALIPFFQGGYFYFEAYVFGAIQVCSLWFLWYKQRKLHLFFGYRIFFYIIVVCSLLIWPTAVDKGMHFFGILKLLAVFFFIQVYDNFETLFEDSQINVKEEVLSVAVISGSVMTLIVVCGILFLEQGNPILGVLVQKQRIGGLIQYANTFGIYLFMILVFVQYALKNTALKNIITVLLTLSIALTQSRATLVLLSLYAMTGFIVGILRKQTRKLSVFALISVVTGLLLGQILLMHAPLELDVMRNMNTTFQTSEWQTRLLYYDDGLRLLIMRPSGLGYLGYHYIQSLIQTESAYHVKFIHSAILQMGLDYGVLAMLAFIALCLWNPIQTVAGFILGRKKKQVTYDLFMLAIGTGIFFGHMVIDFDTEYSVILILLMIALKALERGFDTETDNRKEQDQKEASKLEPIIEGGRSSYFILFGLPLLMALFIYMSVESVLEYSDRNYAALKLFPYDTEALEGLLIQEDAAHDFSSEEKYRLAEALVARNVYNTKGVAFLAQYDYNNSKIEASLLRYEQLIKFAPLRMDYLEAYFKLAVYYCETLSKENKLEDDNKYLRFIATIDTYMKNLKTTKDNNYLIINQVEFELTPKMKEVIEQSSIRQLIQTL